MSKEDEHFRSVFVQLHEYRRTGVLCDAVLVTGSRGVRAHSVILSATSPVLKEALEAKVGSSLRYVYLPDYDFSTLQVAVRFMYTGRLILNCSDHGEEEQLQELVESLRSLGLDIGGCEVEYESILNQEVNERSYSVDFSNFDIPKKQELSKAQLVKLARTVNEDDSSDGEVEDTDEQKEATPTDMSANQQTDMNHDENDTAIDGNIRIKHEDLLTDSFDEVTKPFLIQSINYLISNEQTQGEKGNEIAHDLETELAMSTEYNYNYNANIIQKVKGENDNESAVIFGQNSGIFPATTSTSFDMSDMLELSSDNIAKSDESSVVYATELHGYDIQSLIASGDIIDERNLDESNNLPQVPFVGHAYDEEDKIVQAATVAEENVVSSIKNKTDKKKPLVVRSYRTFRQPFACGRCELRFSTRLGLKRHEEAHNRRDADAAAPKSAKKVKQEGYYPCEKCSKLFSQEAQLQRHEQACHSIDRVYECRFCGSQFNRRRTFLMHEKRHTGERPVLCHLCGRAFAELRLLRAHLKTPHDQYPCSTCSKMFVSRAKLAVHNLTEHGIWLKSRTEKKRRKVVQYSEMLNTYLCDTCGKSFSSSSSLSTHSRIHKRMCQVCDVKLNNESDLIEHMLQNHPGIQYVRRNYCELCAKELSSEKTYTEHMRLHSNDRPFHCVTCGKTFITRARLVFHLQKVHGSTGAISEAEEVEFATKASYQCEYCDKTFRWPDARTAHQATHTGLAPYQCKHCEKRFLYKGSLYAHVRIHTGELPFSCHICGKRFRQATHVKRHMHGHQGTKPYICELCGKGYMGRIDLRNHYTRVHQVHVTQTRCNARNSYSFNLPTEIGDVAISEDVQDVLIEEHCARTDGRALELP